MRIWCRSTLKQGGDSSVWGTADLSPRLCHYACTCCNCMACSLCVHHFGRSCVRRGAAAFPDHYSSHSSDSMAQQRRPKSAGAPASMLHVKCMVLNPGLLDHLASNAVCYRLRDGWAHHIAKSMAELPWQGRHFGYALSETVQLVWILEGSEASRA